MERICSVYILDVPYSADRPYSYAVPGDLAEEMAPGTFVEVPFGRGNRPVTGLCVSVSEPGGVPEDAGKLKYLARVIGGAPVLDEELLGLCAFLKDHTLCTMGDAVRTVIPSGAFGKVRETFRLTDAGASAGTGLAAEILEVFGKKKFTKAELTAGLGRDVTKQLPSLIENGELERFSDVKGMGRAQKIRIISKGAVPGDPDEAETLIAGVRGDNRKKILRYVVMCGEAAEDEIAEQCGISKESARAAINGLAEKGYLVPEEHEIFRNRFTTEWLEQRRKAPPPPPPPEPPTA